MLITFDDRDSDALVVARVWRSHSQGGGTFHSMAACNWGMVVSRVDGATVLTVRGPETRATIAECPAQGEWVGVHFALGTFMPLLPAGRLRDRNDLSLPAASRRSFWLDGARWEYPSYDNMDVFVNRLLKAGLIAIDGAVQDALHGAAPRLSPRSEQRRFLRATGMTHGTIRQIERARRAVLLLQGGLPIAATAQDAGYFDQAHLTRSLRRFVGQTPAQIVAGREQLSLLYKTDDDEALERPPFLMR